MGYRIDWSSQVNNKMAFKVAQILQLSYEETQVPQNNEFSISYLHMEEKREWNMCIIDYIFLSKWQLIWYEIVMILDHKLWINVDIDTIS